MWVVIITDTEENEQRVLAVYGSNYFFRKPEIADNKLYRAFRYQGDANVKQAELKRMGVNSAVRRLPSENLS